jgi:hypothetical protein
VKEALLQSQVRLFAFLLVPPSSLEARVISAKRDMFVSLVEESGGSLIGGTPRAGRFGSHETINYLFNEDSRKKVIAWTQWLNIQVNEFWTLDIAAPPAGKKTDIKVEIISRDGKVRKDIGVTYPRLLRPQR